MLFIVMFFFRIFFFLDLDLRLVLGPAHDGHGPLDPGERGDLGDLDDGLPVLDLGNQLTGVLELDLVRGDAECDEAVLHVPGAGTDVLEVSAELVVDVGVPVCPEDGHPESCVGEVPDLLCDENPAEVDETGGFETDVCGGFLLLGEKRTELILCDEFLCVPEDNCHPFIYIHLNQPSVLQTT